MSREKNRLEKEINDFDCSMDLCECGAGRMEIQIGIQPCCYNLCALPVHGERG